MDLQHSFTVPIGIDEAWAAFTDIERIAPCLPGAAITSVDGDEFTGTAKVKLGPISMQYSGKGTWVSKDPDTYRAVIEAQGKDKRGNGTAGATITAHLEPDGAATRVVVDTELKITGRPAQFGRGVIQDVGGKLLDQFASCLAVRLAEGSVAETSGAAATDAAGVAATASAPGDGAAPVPDPTADEGLAAPAAAAPVEAGVAGASATPAAPDGPAAPVSPAVPVAADAPAASVAPSAPAAAAPPSAPAAARPSAPVEPVELDLGSVVGPALLKRLGPVVVGVVVIAVIVWLIVR